MFIYVIRNIACGFIVLEIPAVIFITGLKFFRKSRHFIIHKNYWNVNCKQITDVIFIPILLNNWRLKCKWYFYITYYLIVLDIKLSLCFECFMLSSGWFTGVWSLNAKVSENLSHLHRRVDALPPMKMEQIEFPKLWHLKFRSQWITQKKVYNVI
jgi:hypothetical protein